MADKGAVSGPQHHIPPPRTQGAATGGQQLSATATQFVDKIDPFSKRFTFNSLGTYETVYFYTSLVLILDL